MIKVRKIFKVKNILARKVLHNVLMSPGHQFQVAK